MSSGPGWSALQLLLQGVDRAALTMVTKIRVHAALLRFEFVVLIPRCPEIGNQLGGFSAPRVISTTLGRGRLGGWAKEVDRLRRTISLSRKPPAAQSSAVLVAQKDGQAGTQNLKTRPAAIDDLQRPPTRPIDTQHVGQKRRAYGNSIQKPYDVFLSALT
jgi:hypothetical protein